MKPSTTISAVFLLLWPVTTHATPNGYTLTITTAFAYANDDAGDPFPNRIDHVYTGAATGFFQVALTGEATFSGVIGTIAVAGYSWVTDMSYRSNPLVLGPGGSVSVAIPYDSSSVGGFNGPIYNYRPGVEIYLDGWLTDGTNTQPFNLLVADRDIHSGVWLAYLVKDWPVRWSDSFVLQGGDPWGWDTDKSISTSLAHGIYQVSGTVAEPGSLATLAAALLALAPARRLSPRCLSPRRLKPRRA